MAEVTPKRAGEMVRGLFGILALEPKGIPPAEALSRLAASLPPSPFEASYYPNFPKVRRYEQLVRFHTIGAVKAGWLIKDGGVWLLTDEGRQALKDYPDPVAFKKAEDKKYREWRASQGASPAVAVPSPLGPTIVPEPEGPPTDGVMGESAEAESVRTEVQWLLLKLGNDLGLDVWVAKNDVNRSYKGNKFIDLPKLRHDLPLAFDTVTKNTVALIDVLWLKSNSIVAAFEVESTTSIYSGLLRMADLIALQPNLNIPLYIVAAIERRKKVIEEIDRPTFRRLDPPMSEVTRFIPFSALRTEIEKALPLMKVLKPDFIDLMAESTELD
jgi:hypothetical protein